VSTRESRRYIGKYSAGRYCVVFTNFEGMVEGLIEFRPTIGVDNVIPRVYTERNGDGLILSMELLSIHTNCSRSALVCNIVS
jgi:hypothetical protein